MNKLILGDGLLGSELKKQTNWDICSRRLSDLDINNLTSLEKIIKNYKVIVNCIADTDTYSKNKENHYRVNYRFPSNLSNICENLNIKLIHISTDYVYANNLPVATEDELPLPSPNWYSYTKLLADEYICLTNSNYLICRLSHKPYPFPYDEVWDVITSGDTVDKIASLVIKLIEKESYGLVNVGTGTKNLYKIAPNKKVIERPIYVPYDTSMNLDKMNKLLNK
jgi:hypothetical protein